jgi:hypothetical protein
MIKRYIPANELIGKACGMYIRGPHARFMWPFMDGSLADDFVEAVIDSAEIDSIEHILYVKVYERANPENKQDFSVFLERPINGY